MTDEIIRTIQLTVDKDQYRGFLSDDWCETLEKRTSTKASLSEIAIDLMMEWRAAAYTASLPVAVIDQLKGYHDAFVKDGDLNTGLLRLADALISKLTASLPEVSLDPTITRNIRKTIVEIGAELIEARDKAKSEVEFPLEATWQEYLKKSAFQLSIWGSQRVCFVAAYNAFENFVVRTIAHAVGCPTLRVTDSNFKTLFRQVYGDGLFSSCWTNNQIHVARLARHALSHAGGRLTKALSEQTHGFETRDGYIQITPEKNRELFALLQGAVSSLVETAVTLASFV